MKNVITLTLLFLITQCTLHAQVQWILNTEADSTGYLGQEPKIHLVEDTILIVDYQYFPSTFKAPVLIARYDLSGNLIDRHLTELDSGRYAGHVFDGNHNLYALYQEGLGRTNKNILLVKYDGNFDKVWEYRIAQWSDSSFEAKSLKLVNDTSLVIHGVRNIQRSNTSREEYFFVGEHGNLLNHFFFADTVPLQQIVPKMITLLDTTYIFAVSSFPGERFILAKLHPNITPKIYLDVPLWGGLGDDFYASLQGLILAGGPQYKIAFFDHTLQRQWKDSILSNPPIGSRKTWTSKILEDSNGDIYVLGASNSPQTDDDIFVKKVSKSGASLWTQWFPSVGNNSEIPFTGTFKNGYLYVGANSVKLGPGSTTEYVTIKLDTASGNIAGHFRYLSPAGGKTKLSDIHVFDNGNVLLTGESPEIGGPDPDWYWTTIMLTDITVSNEQQIILQKGIVFPNPVKPGAELHLHGKGFSQFTLLNMEGKQIAAGSLMPQQDEQSIRIPIVAAGTYHIELKTQKRVFTEKMVVRN